MERTDKSSKNVAAEYKLMLAHLRQPGASLSVIPEGIAGIFLAQDKHNERIFLSKRKGFVKLAIQAGAGEHPLSCVAHSEVLPCTVLIL
jgi:2-acylglycerol O-acyltransferase 2